jgi:hypothetical protein
MSHRRARALRTFLAACVAALAALAALAAEPGRAADCFAPLALNDKWSCTADLSTGGQVPYCLNVTATSGEGASRTFDMVATGPYPRVCTCGAKGKGARARFNTASSYICFDAATDTAETGTITRKKLSGQMYNVSADVRATFSCVPDPACAVPVP